MFFFEFLGRKPSILDGFWRKMRPRGWEFSPQKFVVKAPPDRQISKSREIKSGDFSKIWRFSLWAGFSLEENPAKHQKTGLTRFFRCLEADWGPLSRMWPPHPKVGAKIAFFRDFPIQILPPFYLCQKPPDLGDFCLEILPESLPITPQSWGIRGRDIKFREFEISRLFWKSGDFRFGQGFLMKKTLPNEQKNN